MEILDKLENNTIVITNYNYKEYLLKEISKTDKLLNISFLSMKELINRYYFSYDYNAIYYLMDKYEYKYDVAKTYLDNLIYVEDKNYNILKLDKLVIIKKELEESNLLIYDKYFKDYLKSKKILFLGFNYFKSFESNLLEELKSFCDVEIIEKEYKEYNPPVYEFNTLEEEVEYVAINIIKLIEKGIDLKNIKITNFNDDYLDSIRKIFSFYNLDIDYRNDKLTSTKVVSEFFLLTGSIEERIKSLSETYKNNKVLESLIKVANKYISFNNLEVTLSMIKEELKNETLSYDKTSNMIEIIDYKNSVITDEMHVFMISFNNSSIPIIYKDEDYITDNLKEDLYLDSTNNLNELEKESTINNLLSIKNLTITYKKTSFYDTFLPSNLIEDLNLNVEKKEINLKESYSNINTRVTLSKLIDNYLRTGIITDNLKLLYSNFKTNYSSYDNSFKGLDKNLFKEYINSSYHLSYSTMDNYYKCPFKYYIANVLNLNIFEDTFVTYLGSLFHYVLENNLKTGTDIDTLIKQFITENERELTKKEQFFVEKTKKEIEFSLKFIKEHLESTNLKNMLFENKVEIDKKSDFDIIFKGFVDKIMYEETSDKTIMSIIDYKTGDVDTDLRKTYYGLSMQLPIYLYLASHSNFKNLSFAGFYIQRVLSNEVLITPGKTYEDLKRENLKLQGYSNSDEDILHEFDPTYKESKYIKSMKLNDNGSFYYHAKVLSDNQINNLINHVDSKIDSAIESINNCEFNISPKATSKENLGCKYCKFYDVCFKENKDINYITFPKDLSFLGGEQDA